MGVQTVKSTSRVMFGFALGGLMALGGLGPGIVGLYTAQASKYALSAKQVIWDGHVVSTPMGIAAVDPSTGNPTTYMPIWYVMQALKAAGIQSGWDGTTWTMRMPSGDAPNIDLTTVNPGSGQKRIVINGVDVQNVNGIVYPDLASHINTTYIPIWYVMKVLHYENITSKWTGQQWAMTPSLVSASAPSATSTVAPGNNSGVNSIHDHSGVQGGAASTGSMPELWVNNGHDVTLDNVGHGLGSNLLPVKGHVNGTRRDDVVVEVVAGKDQNWFYSVPVDSNGDFAATITLPFRGQDYVEVGYPITSDSFGLDTTTAAYAQYQNNQPTLAANEMALLQSWMVNYNEVTQVRTLALTITGGAKTTDAAIRAVSDWVSYHIYYNFPELNQNQFVWQQATKTMDLGYGVCQDQAALAAALLRSINIPTQVVDGEAMDPTRHQDIGGHAWNKAWDGSQWITFDACWDQEYFQDTQIAPPAAVLDDYFNPSQTSFNETHIPDANQPFGWSFRP